MKCNEKTLVPRSRLKIILNFTILQALIIVFLVGGLYQNRSINLEEAKTEEFWVSDTDYIRLLSEFKLIIYSEQSNYVFDNFGRFAEYSNRDLFEAINKGEYITVTYIQRLSIVGKINYVVEARDENHFFRTIEEYNSQKLGGRILIIILFFIIECIYIASIWLYYLMHKKF